MNFLSAAAVAAPLQQQKQQDPTQPSPFHVSRMSTHVQGGRPTRPDQQLSFRHRSAMAGFDHGAAPAKHSPPGAAPCLERHGAECSTDVLLKEGVGTVSINGLLQLWPRQLEADCWKSPPAIR